ncbi:hypothetical protein CU669_17815 [Paramagnetospirillum kuznetsovii]|uniref:Sensor protein n=1 Tax=Paramagnetospirillum kuznetsovii TaxID=2053833 RepID=A0A364NUB4_9PROT|nr:heavy metal sensor histidine kinase [Paramagnetospirillum kuznetsovii]RAU20505.1 hypothetical protein CU669_17815 [Paramagnetospirillum kuznetsovii]
MRRLHRLASRLRSASASIAGRLTLWFTVTSLILLLAKSLVTYWAIAPLMAAQEEQYVVTKAKQIGVRVTNALIAGGDLRVDALIPPDTLGFVRIRHVNGTLIAEAQGMEDELPSHSIPSLDQAMVVRGHSGRQYWMAEYRGDSNAPITVQVASEATEFRLMAPTGGRLWAATTVALFLSGFAGYQIARRCIRPLQNLAESVQATGGSTLARRIDPSGLPQELQPLCDSFNSMLERLQTSFDRVSHVTDDIAHELRTPLSIMTGQIDVALTTERPAVEYREVLESVREEISTLSDMVQRLLFLSRVENQSIVLHVDRLDLAMELAAVQELYEPLALEAGVSLTLAPPRIPVFTNGDRLLLRRAIINLVSNAIRHTPAGGQVVLATAHMRNSASIVVSDTGCGIAGEDLPFLFDRFFRLDRARETAGGHIGLGLAIVKAIIAQHGGTVDLQSRPGQGTTVTLILPYFATSPD